MRHRTKTRQNRRMALILINIVLLHFTVISWREKNLNLFLKETQTRRQTFLCRDSKEATVSSKGDMGWKVYIFVKYLYQKLILNCSGMPSHPNLICTSWCTSKLKYMYIACCLKDSSDICHVWNKYSFCLTTHALYGSRTMSLAGIYCWKKNNFIMFAKILSYTHVNYFVME